MTNHAYSRSFERSVYLSEIVDVLNNGARLANDDDKYPGTEKIIWNGLVVIVKKDDTRVIITLWHESSEKDIVGAWSKRPDRNQGPAEFDRVLKDHSAFCRADGHSTREKEVADLKMAHRIDSFQDQRYCVDMQALPMGNLTAHTVPPTDGNNDRIIPNRQTPLHIFHVIQTLYEEERAKAVAVLHEAVTAGPIPHTDTVILAMNTCTPAKLTIAPPLFAAAEGMAITMAKALTIAAEAIPRVGTMTTTTAQVSTNSTIDVVIGVGTMTALIAAHTIVFGTKW